MCLCQDRFFSTKPKYWKATNEYYNLFGSNSLRKVSQYGYSGLAGNLSWDELKFTSSSPLNEPEEDLVPVSTPYVYTYMCVYIYIYVHIATFHSDPCRMGCASNHAINTEIPAPKQYSTNCIRLKHKVVCWSKIKWEFDSKSFWQLTLQCAAMTLLYLQKSETCQARWFMCVVPALRKLRQED